MKKIIVLILSVSMVMASTFTAYAADFNDVKQGNWAYEAVSAMSAKAVLSGYPDGSFKPGNTVTYGEFIKMALVAATGEDAGNSTSGNWAENYYSKAKELGYYTEYDINKNSLSRQITRAHMALIISSILGDVKINQYDEIQKGITDITFKTPYEYDITKAYAMGVLTGYTDNTFKPEKTLSRAEAATVIHRLVDESKRVMPIGEEPKEPEDQESTFKMVNIADYVDVGTVANVRKLNPNDKYSVYGDFTAKAELYNNANSFDVTINKEWAEEWGSSFNHKLSGFIYLVKDTKIIGYCSTLPNYDADGEFLYSYFSMADIDVRTADYIVCVSANVNTNILAKIVPNPLKK